MNRPMPAAPGIDVTVRGTAVGKSTLDGEFEDKIAGTLAYAADRYEPGMLYGKVVRSILPAADIRSVDISEALTIPGVVAVLTAKEVGPVK